MGKKAKFIVIEGLDGCGKSTQAKLLAERFAETGVPHILTREPSDGAAGRFAREAIDGVFDIGNEALAMIIAADRTEHVVNEILPALKRGESVICDRYYYSSFAYQGRETPFKRVKAYNERPISLARPDTVVFLDLSPDECLSRISHRLGNGKAPRSIFDDLTALREARERYFQAFEFINKTERIFIININGLGEEETAEQVWNAIKI